MILNIVLNSRGIYSDMLLEDLFLQLSLSTNVARIDLTLDEATQDILLANFLT